MRHVPVCGGVPLRAWRRGGVCYQVCDLELLCYLCGLVEDAVAHLVDRLVYYAVCVVSNLLTLDVAIDHRFSVEEAVQPPWVEAAREALAKNRRPANAGRRFWDLSGGILRCSECGRAMTARTALKQYFYCACTVGPAKRKPGCEAKKFHKAAELEEWVWGKLCSILTDPEKLRAGLEEMIERERQAMLGDPVKEASLLKKRLAKIAERRGRYQEMAAQGLIDFEELRSSLAHVQDERKDTQAALEAIQSRQERLENLERGRRELLEHYGTLVPEEL